MAKVIKTAVRGRRALSEAREVLMGQLAAVAEEAGQLQSDLQHKAGIIAAQVRAPPHRFLHLIAG